LFERVRFNEVLDAKRAVLSEVFSQCAASIREGAELTEWMAKNEWVRAYSAFRFLKDQNEQRPWSTWTELRDPDRAAIRRMWDSEGVASELHFHAWVQMRLEQQLTRASSELSAMGILLKGDLPILMDADSADVWANRDFFNLSLRAGAPPDMFSELGQNWGFPVYNWDALASDDYSWWKNRLRQADKFYHAYRIDHVLGFFRIWAIPSRQESGTMGYFYPAAEITSEQLLNAGFTAGRIRWLSEPHIEREIVDRLLEGHTELMDRCFLRIGSEDLFLFSSAIQGERDITELPVSPEVRDELLSIFRDRALLRTGPDTFAPSWKFRECSRYDGLFDEEKEQFESIVAENGTRSEVIWEQQGRRLLSFMNTTVPMLTCAEDLGVIPESVPRVLEDLGILGLRIPRWARRWSEEGQPYTKPMDYPFLTVCALSVHDTATMREWWKADPSRKLFWKSIGLKGACPDTYDVATARVVTRAVLDAGSAICIFQIQDLLAASENLRVPKAEDERVNVPGTYNDVNWTYRIPVRLEELEQFGEWCNFVRETVFRRRERSVSWKENQNK
jgi:4-alpha-glucanotransferase